MNNMIHIVYGTDNNYWFPTAVSAASAVHFAEHPEELVIHLFDAGVTDENFQRYCEIVTRPSNKVHLERHCLSREMFSGFGAWKGSVVTYSRMFMAELLPDLDWAIYVDGDTLWLGDPAELWSLRDDSLLVQASIDPPTYLEFPNPEFTWYRDHGMDMHAEEYLCMGLMMANLKTMREESIPTKCREFMSRISVPRVVDQTVLNWVCRGRTKALPKNWGVFSDWHGEVDLSKPSIVHYCQDVPWVRRKPNKLFSDVVMLWFEFCSRVLGLNELEKFSRYTYFWRRGVYNVLRHLQPIVRSHVQIRGRLRNTHGIPRKQYDEILKRF